MISHVNRLKYHIFGKIFRSYDAVCLASHLFSKTIQNVWCLKIFVKRWIFRFQGNLHSDPRWAPDLVLRIIQLDFLQETLWKWPTAVGTHGTGDCPGLLRATLVLRFAVGQNGRQAACGGPHSWPRCPVKWTPRRRAEHLGRFSVKAAKSRLDFHFHIQCRTSGRSRGGFAASYRLLERDIHAVLQRNRKTENIMNLRHESRHELSESLSPLLKMGTEFTALTMNSNCDPVPEWQKYTDIKFSNRRNCWWKNNTSHSKQKNGQTWEREHITDRTFWAHVAEALHLDAASSDTVRTSTTDSRDL